MRWTLPPPSTKLLVPCSGTFSFCSSGPGQDGALRLTQERPWGFLSAGIKAEDGMATLNTARTTFQDLISYFGEMLVFRSTLLGMPQCTSVYVYNDSLLEFMIKTSPALSKPRKYARRHIGIPMKFKVRNRKTLSPWASLTLRIQPRGGSPLIGPKKFSRFLSQGPSNT